VCSSDLGFVAIATMDFPEGIDVKNGKVYVTHFKRGRTVPIPENNHRYVREFDLTNGSSKDISIWSRFTDDDPPKYQLNSIAVNGGIIWSALRDTVDGSDFNLYKHNTSGQQMNRFKVGPANTIINDIAVDSSTGLLYIASPTTFSVIKYDDNTPENSQTYFTGNSPINPVGLGVDNTGNVYVSDASSGKIIKYAKLDGAKLLEFDGKGKNGNGEIFGAVGDVAVDPRNGDIYVLASAGGQVKLFRYNADGNFLRSVASPDLTSPRKLSIANDGTIYAVDAVKKTVLAFAPGKTP
jgi:sugar lactone lactonase YvrE